nr:MAG: putative RNA dependent RNA polymerase [Beijing forest mitovirus 3]
MKNHKLFNLLRSGLLYLKKIFTWHDRVKPVSVLFVPMLNIGRSILGRLNPAVVKATFIFLKSLVRIQKKSGLKHMCKYLKAVNIYIMQYVATKNKQKFINSSTFDVHVSLTKSGLPRILPRFFRVLIRDNHSKGIKYILTITNLYRVLPFQGRLKLSTITNPFTGRVDPAMIAFVKRYLKLLNLESNKFSWDWDPFAIHAKGSLVHDDLSDPKKKIKGNSTSGFLKALFLLNRSPLWPSIRWFFIEFSKDNIRIENVWKGLNNLLNKYSNPEIMQLQTQKPISLGKLAFKQEPGKIRVFAMVDCITQWVLNPLHSYLFSILRNIKQDGTFDQDKAVRELQIKLKKCNCSYSFDLSAATDRLPILLQVHLLNAVYPSLGDHWSNLLVNRNYSVPQRKESMDWKRKHGLTNSVKFVRYATGQPMGALSSWAMLAFTHHFVVQYAHFLAYSTNKWFTQYLILGDDLVILDNKVAKHYLSIMRQLDVGVNPSKSLVSPKGVAEFAKRLVTSEEDLSGLSLKEFASLSLGWSHVINLTKKLKLTYYQFHRFIGFGAKSAGHNRNYTNFGHRHILLIVYEWCSTFRFSNRLSFFKWFFDRCSWDLGYLYHVNIIKNKQFIKQLFASWKFQLPELVASRPSMHMIATTLRAPSYMELLQVRQWSIYIINQVFPFKEKDLTKGQLELLTSFDLDIISIFEGSSLYHFLVWGRRANFQKECSEYLGLHQSPNISHYNLTDFFDWASEDVKTWFESKDIRKPSLGVSHLVRSVTPVSPSKAALLKSLRETALAVEMRVEAESAYRLRYTRPLLEKPPAPPRRPRFF